MMRVLHGTAAFVAIIGLAVWPVPAFAGGGGGGGGGGPCAAYASGDTLVMLDSCFDGIAHFAAAGGVLTVRNDGQAPHSYTAVDGSFDTGLLDPGETAEIPVGKSGLIPTYCTLHGTREGHGMAGLLVVGQPSAQSISAAAPAGYGQKTPTHEHTALAAELAAQGQVLEDLQAEVAQLKETGQAAPAGAGAGLAASAAAGLAGLALGGAAFARSRRRDISLSEKVNQNRDSS